ncbi:winged helix-turn-helix domain-containing protein [Roseibium alexandrii]|uniref:winged helix-turn-helix domain-containing protein n=1 Tax=Roseibium alexandrii TaxID=388408 RepID=UPI003752A599
MDSCKCPTCGATLPKDGVLLDRESGIVIANGRFAQLPKNEFALFAALWDAGGRVLTKEALMDQLYDLFAEGEEPHIKIIDVYVCKLRKKVKNLPVSVETVWGRGYRILPQQEVKEAS